MFYRKSGDKVYPITPPTLEDAQVPIGTILHYAGAEEPDDWMICDGRELDASIYEALFAAIGYTYGGSNGKFKLPDFRETAAVGVGTRSSSVDVYTLGQFKDQQIASHTHSQGSHTHTGVAHCHPTAVSHSHTTTHCHEYLNCLCRGSSGNYGSSGAAWDHKWGSCSSCSTGSASFTLSSTSFTSSSYGAHWSGATTATNCATGASTGTRGRRIALNFIIYTGGAK